MDHKKSKRLKVAIVTRSDYRSPRVLAESLKQQFDKVGVKCDIFYNINVFTRLNSFKSPESKIKYHFWLRKKLLNFFSDIIFLRKLKSYNAIVVSECSPNGFWRNHYYIEELKSIIKKPVLFYEVYYLGNAPTQIEQLKLDGDFLTERYDWHLAVAEVTEIKSNALGPWTCIGLDLTEKGLVPLPKKEFIAVVDFQQKGFEIYQEEQIRILQELNIKTVVLSGSYSINEIRNLYKQASVFFIQSPEAFCLPIAECFACGVQVFTPNSSWPMAWRLDKNPSIHQEGVLPDIFTIYRNTQDLKERLINFKSSYSLRETPHIVFDSFVKHYPYYYYGNKLRVKEVLDRIKENRF